MQHPSARQLLPDSLHFALDDMSVSPLPAGVNASLQTGTVLEGQPCTRDSDCLVLPTADIHSTCFTFYRGTVTNPKKLCIARLPDDAVCNTSTQCQSAACVIYKSSQNRCQKSIGQPCSGTGQCANFCSADNFCIN